MTQTTANPEPKFAYSIDETGRALSLGRSALYVEIKAGRLRAAKVGRRTIITAEEIERFLRSLPSSVAA